MSKGIKVREKVVDKLSLPKDIVLNMPVIRMVGNREVVIENHSGILEYNTEVIKVRSALGCVILKGTGFHIKDINHEYIYILGNVDSLEFIK
ncbi:MAG: sporulation protein YqfC [Clostridium sp.]